jgi:hypothetical protein
MLFGRMMQWEHASCMQIEIMNQEWYPIYGRAAASEIYPAE